ncbi:hypothetical protein MRX96_004277 [Rhipicephalus microplus]
MLVPATYEGRREQQAATNRKPEQPRLGLGQSLSGWTSCRKWLLMLPGGFGWKVSRQKGGNQGHSREDQGRAGHRSETGSWHDRVGHWATKKRTEMPPGIASLAERMPV